MIDTILILLISIEPIAKWDAINKLCGISGISLPGNAHWERPQGRERPPGNAHLRLEPWTDTPPFTSCGFFFLLAVTTQTVWEIRWERLVHYTSFIRTRFYLLFYLLFYLFIAAPDGFCFLSASPNTRKSGSAELWLVTRTLRKVCNEKLIFTKQLINMTSTRSPRSDQTVTSSVCGTGGPRPGSLPLLLLLTSERSDTNA